MRLVCPSCQAAYDVPAEKLGRGAQRLRCARCAHVWSFVPAPPVARDPAPPPPLPAPSSLAAETLRARSRGFPTPPRLPPYPRRPGGTGPLLGWVLSIALLAGLGFAGWHWRDRVMVAWPPSERVYRVFGAR